MNTTCWSIKCNKENILGMHRLKSKVLVLLKSLEALLQFKQLLIEILYKRSEKRKKNEIHG